MINKKCFKKILKEKIRKIKNGLIGVFMFIQ